MKKSKRMQWLLGSALAGTLVIGSAGFALADTNDTTGVSCMTGANGQPMNDAQHRSMMNRMMGYMQGMMHGNGQGMMKGQTMHRSMMDGNDQGMMQSMMSGMHGMMHQHIAIQYKNVAQAERPLAIPPILTPTEQEGNHVTYSLTAQQGETELLDGHRTQSLGYNGAMLGPVLRLTKGQQVTMKLSNRLDEPTTFHWHGLKVDSDADGGPHNAVQPSEDKTVQFTVDQQAATLWYHPHYMGNTARQVYQGLAGLILVEDSQETALPLPRTYGVDDIPLVIQDRYFTEDGRIDYNAVANPDGTQGDVLIVNGTVKPYITIKSHWVRYRIVNGSNASNFDVALSGHHNFYQVASDGGLLTRPVSLTTLRLSPGERAEIVVDMSQYKVGETAQVTVNGATALAVRIADVADTVAFSPDMALTTIAPLPESDTLATLPRKHIELQGMGPMVSINGRTFSMERIDEQAVFGTQEIWEVTNPSTMMGGMIHPFHMHGVQFRILSRNGQTPPAQEQGWKDTVLVNPDEKVELLVRYERKGVFMLHCHILEHEENGMMGQFEVK